MKNPPKSRADRFRLAYRVFIGMRYLCNKRWRVVVSSTDSKFLIFKTFHKLIIEGKDKQTNYEWHLHSNSNLDIINKENNTKKVYEVIYIDMNILQLRLLGTLEYVTIMNDNVQIKNTQEDDSTIIKSYIESRYIYFNNKQYKHGLIDVLNKYNVFNVITVLFALIFLAALLIYITYTTLPDFY